MPNPDFPPSTRPPFLTDIPDPILYDPPPELLSSEGVYIPPKCKPHIKLQERDDPGYWLSQEKQLLYGEDEFRTRRWKLPSWGWVGVRTYYGHSDAEWDTFRRRIIEDAYWVMETDEEEKFRIIWVEDREGLDGVGEGAARKAFEAWFLAHSDPPNMYDCLIPTIKEVWSGYETNIFLVADREVIDSVLADTSPTLDLSAYLKVLAHVLEDEDDMRKYAPRLIGRYTGSFRVSPHYLPWLDGRFHDDDCYGAPGHASTWYLRTGRIRGGVLRMGKNDFVDEDFGKDPLNLGGDSSDEEEESEGEGDEDVRDES